MTENSSQKSYAPIVYGQDEIETLEAHIEKYYGKFEGILHELVSPDIHVDIALIKPTEKRNYWVLVTMGMGARPMKIPAELAERGLEMRAEIVACLPPDWNMESDEERWYWPLRWLKILARLPGDCDTWLGWGHTVPKGGPMAENTALSGVMLVNPGAFDVEGYDCELPGGKTVSFYQMLPLYDEEMDFKLTHGADALLDIMEDDMLEYICINRKNVCT